MCASGSRRRVSYRVGEQEGGTRLDLFLKRRIPRMSRERIKEAIRSRVSLPGRGKPRPGMVLRPGEEVVVTFPALGPSPEEAASAPEIPVLHVDDRILVVDKPAGLLVHSTTSSRGSSLTSALASRFPGPLHLVHRLDRETSGVVVLGRSPADARALSMSFAAGDVEKVYLAVVFGTVRADHGCMEWPIGGASGSAVHVKQGVDQVSGKKAATEFRVLRRAAAFTLLELRPRTGRRHQLRVHLQAAGHPIVGDKLYGPRETHHLRFLERGFDEKMRREILTERQLLHASRLALPHPSGSGRVEFTAPIPEDMRAFLERS